MSSTLDPGANPDVHAVSPEAGDAVGAGGTGGTGEDPSLRRRRALRQSAGDMVRSMLVIVGIVVVIVLLVPRPSQVPRRDVDVAAVARGAAARLPFEPAVPQGLPAGWAPTSADVRDSGAGITTWHIGYQTPDGHYASVEQALGTTGRWEEILTSGGTPEQSRTIDGTGWEQRYTDVRDVHALIHRTGDRTIMITSKGGGLENAAVLARSIPVASR